MFRYVVQSALVKNNDVKGVHFVISFVKSSVSGEKIKLHYYTRNGIGSDCCFYCSLQIYRPMKICANSYTLFINCLFVFLPDIFK